MNKLDEAVRNNAIWCDAVSGSHGVTGRFSDDIWVAQEAVPRFYPNVITLAPDKQDEQLVQVERLLASGHLKNWGVKDSYRSLDLSEHGFRSVIDGQWIFRASDVPAPKRDLSEISWRVLSSENELIAWESGWCGKPASQITDRVFLAPLIDDSRISIFGAFEGSQVIAGAIAIQAGNVVGVSNIFLRGNGKDELRRQCIDEIGNRYPDTPLVGYESGEDLEAMLGVGFEPIGPVRVWVKSWNRMHSNG